MQVNNVLTEIGKTTGTDKANYHNFTPVYERFLFDKKDTMKQIVEIGVYHGASIKMWDIYFPTCKILGLDINSAFFTEHTFSDKVKLEVCTATNEEAFVKTLTKHSIEIGSVDMIIDDASHIVSHQRKTIDIAWKYVKPGGLYIIEDMHTSIPELIGRHRDIPHDGGYIDVSPKTNDCVIGTMYGFNGFNFDISEIEHIAYISHVSTMSLTCVLTKKR